MDIIESMKREMIRRKYSHKTISTYICCIKQFFKKNHKPLNKLSKKDVEHYLYHLAQRGASGNTINVYLNALKFMMKNFLRKNAYFNIPFSKTPKRIPTILTQDEIALLFSAITNTTHLLMTQLLYATGMRVGELVCLRVRDFSFERGNGWVRGGKGNKDRLFIIADKLKLDLLAHIKTKQLSGGDWLFQGRHGHIHVHTVQLIVKQAAKKAGIKKNVHPHTLRHSFGTHLIENGYDVRTVQALLGHKDIATTMVYIHTATYKILHVQSPYDTL